MVRPELEDTHAAQAQTASLAPRSAAKRGDELPAGLRLGHFRIERKLGAGGMGEVYLATDLALDRPVAVKVLPEASSSGEARERLVREARAQARIQHPNVAHIYFIGEDSGRLYFAMEHVAGTTLADRLVNGPLPVEQALDVIHEAALGLREAERSGITHRDVKPSNLMLDAHGHTKVLDFGLAASAPAGVTDGPVAQTTLGGTPLYMAPEQARGEPVDRRADIYALGATLYHLVSGRPPFQADSLDELVTLHRSAARPHLPPGKRTRTQAAAVDALVARMMATDPNDRFASYDDVLRALELASTEQTRPAGVVVRAIAFAIDFLIMRMLLGGLGMLLPDERYLPVGAVGLPLLAAIWIVCLARWGTSPGKTLFELEVVDTATGRRPRWRTAIMRTLALGALPFAAAAVTGLFVLAGVDPDDGLFDLFALAVVLVLGFAMLHAALRVPGKRTPWDRIGGTIVRYRTRGQRQ